MPRSIGKQPLGSRAGIARRQIAVSSAQAASPQQPSNFPEGAYTFIAPRAGQWKFVAWGPGFSTVASPDGGDSGGYAEYTRFLPFGAAVAIVAGTSFSGGTDTTLTFPDGHVVTAGRGTGAGGAGPGVATGGDVNINGNAGTVGANPGASAPTVGGYHGGSGGGQPTAGVPARSPGGGASTGTNSAGNGMVIAAFLRD